MIQLSDIYQQSIKILQEPPEFRLNDVGKSAVIEFEHSLCSAEFPSGFTFLASRINKPKKNIVWIAERKSGLETLCLDWYLQTKEGQLILSSLGAKGNINTREDVKKFMSKATIRAHRNDAEYGYIESNNWGRQQLEKKLHQKLEKGQSSIAEPSFFSVFTNPGVLIDIAVHAEELKCYYLAIEAAIKSQQIDDINEAKLVMLGLHKRRLNALIASNYRNLTTLLEQYKLAPSILNSVQVDQLYRYFPNFKKTNINDIDKMAKIYSVIDKFITGMDIENGFGKIESEIEYLLIELQKNKLALGITKNNIEQQKWSDITVDATALKKLFEEILKEYNLLDESGRGVVKYQKNKKWRVVISDLRENLSVYAEKGIIWIPKDFKRNLYQKKPVGVLPLINHEITHVIQHKNGASLNIGLLELDRASRASIWFEVGATEQENQSFLECFNIHRGPNLHYLRAMQTQLRGGNISDCIFTFYKSLVEMGDITNIKDGISFATERTLRLFKNGIEYTSGSHYVTNTEPIEFAWQELFTRQLPENLQWLYFVGRANCLDLTQLHRIGWLNKEDMIVPERLPSAIVEPYVRDNILSVED